MLGGSASGGSLRWNDPDRSAVCKYVQGLALSIGHIPRLWQQKGFWESVETGVAIVRMDNGSTISAWCRHLLRVVE
jgi:hypothetical protein